MKALYNLINRYRIKIMKISGQSMLKKIKSDKQTQIWFEKYDQQAPKAGDSAPDFELRDVSR